MEIGAAGIHFSGARWLGCLRSGAAEDGAGFLVSGDLMKEVADFVKFLGGNGYVPDLVSAFVMQDIVGDQYLAFIRAVSTFGEHRLGKFVHNVTGGKIDIEDVILTSGLQKFDGILSRLSAEQVRSFGADYPRAEDEQIPGGFCVTVDCEFVIDGQGLVILFEVAQRCAGQGEIRQSVSQKFFEDFLPVRRRNR